MHQDPSILRFKFVCLHFWFQKTWFLSASFLGLQKSLSLISKSSNFLLSRKPIFQISASVDTKRTNLQQKLFVGVKEVREQTISAQLFFALKISKWRGTNNTEPLYGL